MTNSNSNHLFVFKEQSLTLGVLPNEFDLVVPLNQYWISQSTTNPKIWKFNRENSSRSGFFVHPASLFGLKEVRFSDRGIAFLKKQSEDKYIGMVLNQYLMKIGVKKLGPKLIAADLVKNLPQNLPKSVFRSVQRFQRKNIFILNFDGILDEYKIDWEE